MRTAEEALKCYSNTTAMIFICGRVMYPKRSPNLLKAIIGDFYLTTSLLGNKAQPGVVVRAMLKVMHSLLGGLYQLERDEYLSLVISDLILHWTPQFVTEFNAAGAVLPFMKFTKSHLNSNLPEMMYESACKVLLTPHLQRDVLAVRLFREVLSQSKNDARMVRVLLSGCLLRCLEYYCKCEDFAPVKKGIVEFLDEVAMINFLEENAELRFVGELRGRGE